MSSLKAEEEEASGEGSKMPPVFVFGATPRDGPDSNFSSDTPKSLTTTTTAASSPEDSSKEDVFFHLGRSDPVGRTGRGRTTPTATTPTTSPTATTTLKTRPTAASNEDNDADEEEGSDECSCENCVANRQVQTVERNEESISSRRIVRAIRPVRKREHQEMSRTEDEAVRDEEKEKESDCEEDEDEDDDIDECSCENCVARRRREERGSDSSDEESSYDEDDDEDYGFDFNPFRYLEDDDSDDVCSCPRCTERRAMSGMMQAFSSIFGDYHRSFSRFERESDEEEDCASDDSTPEENAPTCAICLEPEMRKRPLVVLPCCGSNGKEYASTTRFCNACVHKCLKSDDAPSHSTWRNSLIGECPRCKYLLVKDRKLKSTIKKASPEQMIWYAGHKESNAYRCCLIFIAWCYSRYIPEEVFTVTGVSLEIPGHLCRWGLLRKYQHRKQQNLYWIDPDAQEALRSWTENYIRVDFEGGIETVNGVDNVDDNRRKIIFFISLQLLCATVEAGRKFNVWRCFRLVNRAFTLLNVAARVLPNFDEWSHRWDGWLVSCLTVFVVWLVFKILVKVFWILLYGANGWILAKAVGFWIRPPPSQAWKRHFRLFSMVFFGATLLAWVYLKCPVVFVRKGTKAELFGADTLTQA